MNVTDFAARYSTMSDDEILGLACAPTDLKPEAHFAVESELQRRKLSQADIEGYRNHLIATKPSEVVRPIAMSWNGFGTSIYGKCDFRPDGSFLTTKWIVIYFLPILPIKSMRVSRVGRRYLIHDTGRPNIRQTLYVYSFASALALALFLTLVTTVATKQLEADFSYAAVLCVCLAPWLLRRIARQRSRQRG